MCTCFYIRTHSYTFVQHSYRIRTHSYRIRTIFVHAYIHVLGRHVRMLYVCVRMSYEYHRYSYRFVHIQIHAGSIFGYLNFDFWLLVSCRFAQRIFLNIRTYTYAFTRTSFTEEQQKAGILRRGLWGVVRRRPPLGSLTASQAGETGQINAPNTGERLQYSNRLHIQKNLQILTRSSDLTIDPATQPNSSDKPRDIKQKQYIYPTQQQ